jgi:hypothetical protein
MIDDLMDEDKLLYDGDESEKDEWDQSNWSSIVENWDKPERHSPVPLQPVPVQPVLPQPVMRQPIPLQPEGNPQEDEPTMDRGTFGIRLNILRNFDFLSYDDR